MGKLGLINENLLDTLYGGIAGQLPLPLQDIQEFLNVSDSETKQSQTTPEKVNFEVIPTHQVLAATSDEQVDIRPRFYDTRSGQYVLVGHWSPVLLLTSTSWGRAGPEPCGGSRGWIPHDVLWQKTTNFSNRP